MKNKILKNLGFSPTEQQRELIGKLGDFIGNRRDERIFLLKGYAGTGKTTVISAVVNALAESKIQPVLLAPTGRAAKVFSKTAHMSAFTIHKKIYRIESKEKLFSKFILDINKYENAIFIIDEASMISNSSDGNSSFGSGRLLDDLIKYVFAGKNCKIIFSGDTAQLPPVGMSISPAMDTFVLSGYAQTVDYELTDVVRQSLESGILYNATLVRDMILSNSSHKFPKFRTKGFDDVERISGMDLIEKISATYDTVGLENTIVVTRSNNRANKYNQGIRQSILYKENQLSANDLVMVVKNNYFWKDEFNSIDFIANGDIVHISRVRNFETLYNYNYADAEIYSPDYDAFMNVKLMLDVLESDKPSLGYDEYKEYYNTIAESYEDIRNKKERIEKIMNDEYLNALQMKFAYAVTCHKAQGGQWHTVFIDQPYLSEEHLDVNFLRWLYTALTRAETKLYLVNFKDDFFENP